MLKESDYKEKFALIKNWLPEIIEVVKKDLKNEHLKVDRAFCKRYFLGKNPAQIQADEMAPAYAKDIEEGNVGLGEFIATRWLLKNTDVYGYFEEKLKSVNPDFESLEELKLDVARPLMAESVKKFGAKKTYFFCVFNSVVFPASVYEELKSLTIAETHKVDAENKSRDEITNLESLQKKHEREISALTDRFEKKLIGLQKKYINDVEGLKKQISILQRKLNA